MILLTALLFTPPVPAALPGRNGVEITIGQLNAMNRALATGKRFLVAANRGDLKGVKALCTPRIDPRAPSSGEGGEVIGFRIGSEMKRNYLGSRLRIVNVGLQLAEGKTPLYVLVWMRPTKGKWSGDTALVFDPAVGKIVSIFDASE